MTPDDDLVLPFTLEGGLVRGRLARLGPALDRILDARHGYPRPVAMLVAETCALAAALAAMLKYDGVFTLQIQGDGPVRLVVADITSDGQLRAMARHDAERVAAAGDGIAPAQLLGDGQLAFTVDQGAGTERYQGIVALDREGLAASMLGYFRQSEQLDTALRVAVRPPAEAIGWGAVALMIQRLPNGSGRSPIFLAEDADEHWRRAAILLDSLTPAEMRDPALTPERILHRLFHAETPCLFDSRHLTAGCRCSRDRVMAALASLPPEDWAGLADAEGRVTVTCEFCQTEHVVTLAEIAAARAP